MQSPRKSHARDYSSHDSKMKSTLSHSPPTMFRSPKLTFIFQL